VCRDLHSRSHSAAWVSEIIIYKDFDQQDSSCASLFIQSTEEKRKGELLGPTQFLHGVGIVPHLPREKKAFMNNRKKYFKGEFQSYLHKGGDHVVVVHLDDVHIVGIGLLICRRESLRADGVLSVEGGKELRGYIFDEKHLGVSRLQCLLSGLSRPSSCKPPLAWSGSM
jgi:hypothetical protein